MRRDPLRNTKKPPIKVKWVDRNKGDRRQHMNVRPRPVVKLINTGKEQGLFAATPPTRGFADAAVSNGHWKKAQGVDATT